MSFLPITCDNCGAKFKLPENFAGAKAKCSKCGSAIDVAKQRASVAPAAPAARPATTQRPAAPHKEPSAARPNRSAAKPSKPAQHPRPEKQKSSMLLPFLSLVGLVVIGLVAFFMLSGGDKPAPATPSEASKPEQPAAKPAEQPAAKPAEQPAAKPAEQPAAKPAEQPTAKPAEAVAAKTQEPPDDGSPKRPWQKMKNPPQSMDQVTDPKSYPEVAWPDAADDAQKAKIRGLVEDVVGGGKAGIRAKAELVQLDHPAMYGIVEKLRTLNYRSSDECQLAFELNKLMEEILFDLNARFEPVELSEDIHPAKAEWNTRTVKAWLDLMQKSLDVEAFKANRAERRKKAAGEMK